ncbi:MAG: peptidylprolyl isomerase [Bacteroidales bacterium]|nr:peptidylprolyl isomerase [Bacteroidales bacterium]
MLQLGVDHITTNEPELVQQLIAEKKYILTPADRTKNVVLETTAGTIVLKLYDKTPLHRDNFLALVKEGAYDSLLFHRVIQDFMIQGGDPDSKLAEAGVLLGEGDRNYTVPAEFRLDEGIFHRRGVLAAAREGDDVNPEQRSSAMQFYIVWGKIFDEEGLDRIQERLDNRTGGRVQLTPEMRDVYKTVGGTPHLDGQYTVFGEVVSGLDVVDAIQHVATDENDRPLENVRILRAWLK